MSSSVRRPAALAVLTVGAVMLAGCAAGAGAADGDGTGPITFAVSGPQTGVNAEYGGFWKKGLDLAVDQINDDGGIDGRDLKLEWFDSQSDPKQSVTVAQKIVGDDDIIAEIGDFSSPASMAATPIYQSAGLVQFAFTSSSPDFTKGGDVTFATTPSQQIVASAQADSATAVAEKIAVLYQNTDWGKTTFDIFVDEAKKKGATITGTSAYLPTATDFRSALQKVQKGDPDLLFIAGYDPDESAIIKQARQIGWDVTVFASQFSDTAIELTGDDSDGVYTADSWWPKSDDPDVKAFVSAYQDRYDELPNQFEVGAYDAVNQLAEAVRRGGATREGVLKGLTSGGDLPSVQNGAFTFGEDHRPPAIPLITLKVEDGALTEVK